MKKNNILLFLLLCGFFKVLGQSYCTELNYLGQYVQRMYICAPFQGTKIIDDVDKCYIVSVVAEQIAGNETAMWRKAEVKALRYVNEFLNGSHISSNTVLHTKQDSNGYSYEEIEDFIESRSVGYVQTMQVVSVFQDDQGKKVFVYCKELPIPDKPKGKKNKRR